MGCDEVITVCLVSDCVSVHFLFFNFLFSFFNFFVFLFPSFSFVPLEWNLEATELLMNSSEQSRKSWSSLTETLTFEWIPHFWVLEVTKWQSSTKVLLIRAHELQIPEHQYQVGPDYRRYVSPAIHSRQSMQSSSRVCLHPGNSKNKTQNAQKTQRLTKICELAFLWTFLRLKHAKLVDEKARSVCRYCDQTSIYITVKTLFEALFRNFWTKHAREVLLCYIQGKFWIGLDVNFE